MHTSQILLVDPETQSRGTLARLLRMHNHAVTEAATEAEARLAALNQRFNLVITEVWPHEEHSLEFVAVLRRLHGSRAIALTAHDPKDFADWVRAGFSGLFRKPIDFDQLLRHIRRLTATPAIHRPARAVFAANTQPAQSANYIGTQAVGLLEWAGVN
jgi:DNA-binding NtrC family response regulator